VSSFNRHWGGGPSGLRPAHVKEALSAAHSDLVSGSLVSLTDLRAKGEASADTAPWVLRCLAPYPPRLGKPCNSSPSGSDGATSERTRTPIGPRKQKGRMETGMQKGKKGEEQRGVTTQATPRHQLRSAMAMVAEGCNVAAASRTGSAPRV